MKKLSATEWRWFFLKATVALLLVHLALSEFQQRYRFGWDSQSGERSTEYRLFLVDLRDKQLTNGQFVAFPTDDRHLPWFPVGTLMVKRVAALPGETVTFSSDGVTVRQRLYPRSNAILAKINLRRPQYPFATVGDAVVPDGQALMLNEMSESFDGRYWGLVHIDRIAGRAIPIL